MTPDLPIDFCTQMRDMLGDEAVAFFQAMAAPPALALRLNPRHARASETAAAPFVESPVPWEPLGRYLRDGARPGADIAHWAGAYYVQEASAMLPAAVLNVKPGERVLDLCAAPGGKSGQLAAALNGHGLLIANDPEPARARTLSQNMERLGVTNCAVVNALPDQLSQKWPEAFDAILVDAPCSGEGMFRREPDARSAWNPAAPQGCARRQAEILDCAAHMLREGGRLVYSTCTYNRSENEDTVSAFLDRHPEFTPEDFALDGLGASKNGMFKLLPHRARGDGQFAALLRKAGRTASSGVSCDHPQKGKWVRGSGADAISTLTELLSREVCSLPDFLRGMWLNLSGEWLYATPEGMPDLRGLRVVSPGLCILRAGRNHIEPAHALAMALPDGLAHRAAALDDAQAIAFLAGEAIPCNGSKGWTLATWRGLPLGWGKQADGMLKNHLPKGLRRQIHRQ